MRTVSVATMRELDRRTIEEYKVPGGVLMARAGAGLALAIQRVAIAAGLEPDFLLVAGRGNNGGDVFAAAVCLQEWGCRLNVRLAGCIENLSGDALLHCRAMMAAGIPCNEFPDEDDWTMLHRMDERCTLVVDGLLGTGASGEPRGTVGAAIDYIHKLSETAYVVAVDIPSGMNGDSGAVEGRAVRADLTVTMAAPKKGFLNPEAHTLLGMVEVVDIGIPSALFDALANGEEYDAELTTASDVQRMFCRRAAQAHKGSYGHVMLVGGSRGFSGAISLASLAACRSGCGLVSAVVPSGIATQVACTAPEIMVKQGDENDVGSLRATQKNLNVLRTQSYAAILVGPGMTPHEDTRLFVDEVIHTMECPMVLDADALNVFAGEIELLKGATASLVLTPHPGELARLLQVETQSIQSDRLAAAKAAAELSGAVVVLKGCGTLVAAPQGPVALNLTGNPGMAKGGSGDVLAGLLAGFCGQGLDPFKAACAAVYVHGLAGDFAAWQYGQLAMRTADLIDCLPRAAKYTGIR